MILVSGVILIRTKNGACINEAREIVDMTVGIVPFDPRLKPDHPARTEVFVKIPLGVVLGKNRITVFVQQTLFGGQYVACAIYIDGTTFNHDSGPEELKTE